MKNTFLLIIAAALLASCHESIEKRAEREAREYTQKNCPTPEVNNTRTDSVTFDTATRTYTYYCSVTGVMDDAQLIDKHHDEISDGLLSNLRQSTEIKVYKEAGFNFAYVLRSTKNKGQVLYKATFKPQSYK